jgi:hypothetical protein
MSIIDPDQAAAMDRAHKAIAAGQISAALEILLPYESDGRPEVVSAIGLLLFLSSETMDKLRHGLELMKRGAKDGDGAAAHAVAYSLRDLARHPDCDAEERTRLLSEADEWKNVARQRGFQY